MEYKISKESVDKVFRPKTIEDIMIEGYESPIEIFVGQMRLEQENNIYRAVQNQGVTVDKEELVKALQYDRGQYDKGYRNGYNAGYEQGAKDIAEKIKKYYKCLGSMTNPCTMEYYIDQVLKESFGSGEECLEKR